MKRLFKAGFYITSLIIIFLAAPLGSKAQIFTNVESGNYNTALAKDNSSNIYVTFFNSGAGSWGVRKYGSDGTLLATVLSSGLTSDGLNYPWGIAVASNGDVYVASYVDNKVFKVPYSGSNTYGAATTFLTGNFYSTIAVDSSDNLYTTEFNSTSGKYDVVKYPAGSTTGTQLFDGFVISDPGGDQFQTPSGIAIAPNGDIYVTDAFSISAGDNGHLYKLAAPSYTAPTAVSTGLFTTAVSVDAAGDVFASEFNGTNYVLNEYAGGTGSPTAIQILTSVNGFYPWGIAALSSGNVFFDSGNDGNGGALVHMVNSADVQASNVTFSNIFGSSVTAGWTNGDGSARTVFIANTSSGTPAPVNGTVYVANPVFGSGSQIGASGWYCVYNGTGSSVNITGLSPSSTYSVMVVESNGSSSGIVYNTNTATNNPNTVTTTAPSHDALLSVFQISNGILSPSFLPATNNYTDNIANITANITLYLTTEDPGATVTVNGNPVTSGVRTDAIPMSIGLNTLTIVVTAQDGTTTNTYSVAVTRLLSNDALFTSIALNPTATLVSTTGPGYLNYTASVPNSVSSIKVIPVTNSSNATLKVNGQAVSSGAASQSIPLPVGQTVITTVVTAQDGTTTKNAIITVTRLPSNDVNLSNLTAGGAILSPAFAAGTLKYADTVLYNTASVTLTPTTEDPSATVTVNGTAVTSGTASGAIPLSVGLNIINTVVTAQNGVTQRTYVTSITRLPPSNNALFQLIVLNPVATLVGTTGPGNLNYTAGVPFAESSVKVIPTAKDPYATITVNGLPVASGTESQSIPLPVGPTLITIVITAQDGITSKTAYITVNRPPSADAGLSNLTAGAGTLSPAFTTTTLHYAASVPFAASSTTITPTSNDPNAIIAVNGSIVTSGTASGAIPLSVGLNTISIVVTAQNDITTKTYTVAITRRPASSNALLASVTTTPTETLVGVNGNFYLNFTVGVPNTLGSIKVTPTAQDPTATIKVNGTAVASGSLSQAIPLSVGANSIMIVLTAQDGVTTKTVAIIVNRAAPPSNFATFQEVSVTKPADNISLSDDGIVVHQAISPNGDGVNDYLAIDNITSYPDNHLTIVDRNGMMVYETKSYDNGSKAFDGHSNGGKLQLPGTYFYSLDYTVNGENRHKTGFIVLKY